MDYTTIRTRRILTFATTALLVAGLGACSSGSDDSQKSQTGPVNMEFWGWAGYEKIVDRWNASHPNTKITFKKIPSGPKGGYTQISNALTAGKGPCLAQIEYQNIPSMLVKNSVMDITQYASDGMGKYIPSRRPSPPPASAARSTGFRWTSARWSSSTARTCSPSSASASRRPLGPSTRPTPRRSPPPTAA
jgi:hypothetical protein